MRNLLKPIIDFQRLYSRCIEKKIEPLKTNLARCFPTIQVAANNYEISASRSKIFEMRRVDVLEIFPIEDADLIKLYKNQMVRNPSPGRATYDLLMVAAKGRCPFCSHNYPRSLDHFLPKDDFPEFSIFPQNLVPSCRDCNSAKLSAVATREEEQYIHPYFDTLPEVGWLKCSIVFTGSQEPILSFYVDPSEIADGTLLARMQKQFKDFHLAQLYSIQASNELSGIIYNLQIVFEKGGAAEVQSYLEGLAISWELANLNSWQGAMYRTLSESPEICKMEWSL